MRLTGPSADDVRFWKGACLGLFIGLALGFFGVIVL